MEFRKELKKIGLTDKEVLVYLACLELGPSPVQLIARKAKVVRATTYVILSGLMQQGLVTRFEQGKKTMFAAEPPLQLRRLLEKQGEEVKDKERLLDVILPELQVLMRGAGDRPSVRYFEGKEGLHAIRQEMVMYSQPGDTIYNFTPTDYLSALFPDVGDEDSYQRQRVAKRIRTKTLFTTKSERVKQQMLTSGSEFYSRFAERRYIPPEHFPSTSGMSIFRDRIAMGSFTGKLSGAVIESVSMANMMRALFELAWQTAAGWQKKSS